MLKSKLLKTLTTSAAFVAFLILGMSVIPSRGRAANDNNGPQDEKLMIQTGLTFAATSGIQLNMVGKDQDMVGLGSFLVNVSGDCNGCHTKDPSVQYTPPGIPTC